MNLVYMYIRRNMGDRELFMYLSRDNNEFLKRRLKIKDGYSALNFCVDALKLTKDPHHDCSICYYKRYPTSNPDRTRNCVKCWNILLLDKSSYLEQKLPKLLIDPIKKEKPKFLK